METRHTDGHLNAEGRTMAISTRWGTPVEVISRIDLQGHVRVRYEDGEERIVAVSYLKSDGGYGEVEDAAAGKPACNAAGD